MGIQTCKHIIDDILWLLVARVVGGYDDLVALLYSLLCHQWTFAFVSVAAASTYSNNLSILPFHNLVDCVEYIFQCIRSMCIIYKSCYAVA